MRIPINPLRATSLYKEFIKLGLKSEVNRDAYMKYYIVLILLKLSTN